MKKIITAQGTEFDANWSGVSTLDGSLRMEIVNVSLPTLYSIFSDVEHTQTLREVFDEREIEYTGYTQIIRLAQMPRGVVVGLVRPN